MNSTVRTGALALALFAGTALVAAPAMAGHDDWNKKSWNKHNKKHYGYNKGWNKNYGYNKGWNKNYGWNNGYGWNKGYNYGWKPRYGYGRPAYGWPYYYGGPGFAIIIR
jgi:hypothetical protein